MQSSLQAGEVSGRAAQGTGEAREARGNYRMEKRYDLRINSDRAKTRSSARIASTSPRGLAGVESESER